MDDVLPHIEWQKSQETHFAEFNGNRASVRRVPGLREYMSKLNGTLLSIHPTISVAKAYAEAALRSEAQ